MNKRLLRYVRTARPDVLMIIKGGPIEANTLWQIRKQTNTIILNVMMRSYAVLKISVPCTDGFFIIGIRRIIDMQSGTLQGFCSDFKDGSGCRLG